ncbi:MAG: histidinol-phosphate transaminase [Lachnospiraceae bacterium]|nr:histidinol-phosphate transaminase [Lachnospiraceae bacterium]
MHGGDIYRNKVNIDFSVNVNPLGIPQRVLDEIGKELDKLSCYPDLLCEELKKKISIKYSVESKNIIVGNGASELFMAIMHGLRPKNALILEPSFLGYKSVCDAVDCNVKQYFLKENQDFLLTEDVLDYIDDSIDIMFLTNPNNPTGRCIEDKLLKKIINKANEIGVTIIVDECFIDFTNMKSIANYVFSNNYDNVIIINAFTKIFSLPGLRLGYGICSYDLAYIINKHLPEWNVSYLAQRAGVKALEEYEYLAYAVDYVKCERERLVDALESLKIKVYPSEANFVLIKSKYDLYDILLKQGILIRDCSNYSNLEKGYYRIAVKTNVDNNYLINALKKSVPCD